ncbi:MAG: hypothetical protein GX845_02665 [Erysipelothrix sp.]|jgi:hypothetical protein|nr:hypothetical protein [Erysipelothrix sp.]
MKKHAWLMLLLMLILSGCMAHSYPHLGQRPAGFFVGIWHGWLAPLALILKIFNPKYTIFAINNTGFGYEVGFYIAIIGGFGGLSLLRKKK